MPSGTDLFLGALRDLSPSIQNTGDILAKDKQRRDEENRKAEAERIREERLGNLATEVDTLIQEAGKEGFDQQTFIQKSRELTKQATEMGDLSSLRALDDIREGLKQKHEIKKAEIVSESETQKEGRRAGEKKKETDTAFAKAAQEAGDKLISTTAPVSGAISAADDALNLTQLAETNPTAAATAVRKLARASGDTGVMSDKDIEAFGGSKAIAAQLERAAQGAISGTLTDEDAKFAKEVAQVLGDNARKKHDEMVKDSVSRFTKNFGKTYEENYVSLTGRSPPKKGESKTSDLQKPKDGSLTVDLKAPKSKIITTSQADEIRKKPEVQASFKALIDRVVAGRTANGNTAPLTEGEMNAIELETWKRLGYQIAPDQKGP